MTSENQACANERAILNFDPFEGDFGEPGDSILSNKMVTARKAGPCSHCAQEIKPGERVRSMSAKFGDFMHYRWCAACCSVMAYVDIYLESDDELAEDAPNPCDAWEARAGLAKHKEV